MNPREDFPTLKRGIIYLDNAATSLRPRCVIDKVKEFYENHNANIHRGIHTLSVEATRLYEEAHRKVAEFIGAKSWREIIFTRNTTEAINLVAYAWAERRLGPGDAVVSTVAEHHSNMVPWQMLRDRRGVELRYIPVTPEGVFDLEAAERLIDGRVKLVAIQHVSNALGVIQPINDIIRMAKQVGAMVLVDGAQSVPHMPVDVGSLGADFLAFSAHKMLGPTGIGVLWAREELLEEMDPFLTGGDMIREVSLTSSTWNELPWKFEAGTPNIAGGVGFGAAVDYLRAYGMDRVEAHERELFAYAQERLSGIKGLRIHGPRDPKVRLGVLPMTVENVHPHDAAHFLDSKKIAVRTGMHCAHPLHRAMGLGQGTIRASFYLYNTREEVDALAEAMEELVKLFS